MLYCNRPLALIKEGQSGQCLSIDQRYHHVQNNTVMYRSRVTKMSNIHHNDVIMSTMASQITSLTVVYSTVYSGADQRKHQCPASLAFVRGIHRWPVNSPHKWPVTRNIFPYDDAIMIQNLNRQKTCPISPSLRVSHGVFSTRQRALDISGLFYQGRLPKFS